MRFRALVGVLTVFAVVQSNSNADDNETSRNDKVQQLASLINVEESEIIETTIIPPSRRLIDTILSNLLPTPPSAQEYEISKSDVIEIEVPIIGSEFISRNVHVDDDEDWKVVDNNSEEVNGSSSIKTSDEMNDQRPLTLSHFQNSPSHHHHQHAEIVTGADEDKITTTEAAQRNFNKQQQKTPAMIDDEGRLYAFKRSSLKLTSPLSVKIYVNNVDERKSCKTKSSCNQVSFAGKTKAERERDIDLQFYTEYSDEDLLFSDLQSSNGLRSRNAKRAAMPDDQMPITPAPRFPPILPLNQPMIPLKKPAIIKRLENESSIERSERINKDLDNIMRFVSVWAHVDKFVSERARSAIRKLAYLSDGGNDYDDGTSLLGSPSSSRRKSANKVDDPFT